MNTIQFTDRELQLLSDLHGYINDGDFMQMNEDVTSAIDDSNTWESIYKKVVEAMSN